MPEPAEPDIQIIANAMIARYRHCALPYAALRALAHLKANEIEGAELWQRVADTVRSIQRRRLKRPPAR
jgi:hypothetical protein